MLTFHNENYFLPKQGLLGLFLLLVLKLPAFWYILAPFVDHYNSAKLLAGLYVMSPLCDHGHETNKTAPYHQLRS